MVSAGRVKVAETTVELAETGVPIRLSMQNGPLAAPGGVWYVEGWEKRIAPMAGGVEIVLVAAARQVIVDGWRYSKKGRLAAFVGLCRWAGRGVRLLRRLW